MATASPGACSCATTSAIAELRRIRAELAALADPVRAAGSLRFFKTAPGQYGAGDRFRGITVPALRTLARRHQDAPLPAVRTLLGSKWHEDRLLALFILVRQYARGDAATRARLHRLYLANSRYVNNWDLVDSSAEHLVGAHLFAGDRRLLDRLARSESLWERRIAMLSCFHFIRRGDFGTPLRIARMLRDDREDLIHKAVGWMLREVGNRDRARLEVFLRRHAARMPRTMLRYAIERLPPSVRRRHLAAGRQAPVDSRTR